MTGKLLAFCGIDGCGKSTQIQLLKKYLDKNAIENIVIKQPSDWYRKNSYVRSQLDENKPIIGPEFLALLSAADRVKQMHEEIIPHLNKGIYVIMDRYVYSAYAYMLARGVADIEWLETINRFHRVPDEVFYIDINPGIALKRILKRDGGGKKEEQDLLKMEKVRKNFKELAGKYNFTVLNGEDQEDVIHSEIVKKIKRRGYF